MIIENLESKLNGSIPITQKEELIYLIDSWGRNSFNGFYIETKECYDLSKLDVSQLDNMYELFRFSLFNGDISNWDVSNVTNMESIFSRSKFNGDLSNWDVSNCKNMRFLFYKSEFNNNSISNWNISNVKFISSMFDCSNFDRDISKWVFNEDVEALDLFYGNESFKNKYNQENEIPNNTKEFLEWFEENRNKIRDKNTTKEEVLDFFSFDNQSIDKEIL